MGIALAWLTVRAGAAEAYSASGYCPGNGSQLCPTGPPYSHVADVTSSSDLSVTWTLTPAACSDVALHLYRDGNAVAVTDFSSPGMTTKAVRVPWPHDGKSHSLDAQGEGRTGGCNVGFLLTWSGSVAVTANQLTVSVGDVRVREPDPNRTATAKFHVTLGGASSKPVSVHYATRDGSGSGGRRRARTTRRRAAI